ncbi:hypothetical protein C8N29_11918 [Agitococcus lubricus]|uniref:Uncharacterized protein n=1 Tax=Agitococcus lubricus TaxID=1077255 RepID=A0A2T5IU12_9GAMM|nr:hypothetical protein C8N29_11918 [Agitococcus lubricus]
MSNSFQYTKAILLDTSLKLSTEEKYFLIRLVDTYGYEKLKTNYFVDKTINELEELLGMSDYLIAKTRDSLIEKGYLIEPEIVGYTKVSRGRPRVRFAFATLIVSMINKLSKHKIEDDHAQRIESLLLWNDKGESHKELTPSNRILLAVLYAHANPCGAVYNLGVMQMAKLSGLKTRDRTEGQLEKLTKLCFILDRVSGTTGKYFFGNVKGEIFLNIFNDGLRRSGASANLILFLYNFNHEYTKNWSADKLLVHSNTRLTKASINEKTVNHLMFCLSDIKALINNEVLVNSLAWKRTVILPDCSWCSDLTDEANMVMHSIDEHRLLPLLLDSSLNTPALKKLLQHKIHYYASMMLSRHWNKITPKLIIIQPLFDELIEQLISKKNKINLLELATLLVADVEVKEQLVKELNENLVEFFHYCIYQLIFETAFLTKGLLEMLYKGEAVDFNSAVYSILSIGYDSNRRMKNFGVIAKFANKRPCHTYKTITLHRNNPVISNFQDLNFLQDDEHKAFRFYVKS